VWFPEGKNDPNLCILRIDAREGEFWDNSGAKGMKMLYEAAKAFVASWNSLMAVIGSKSAALKQA